MRPYHALFLEELAGALLSRSSPLPKRLFLVLDQFSELLGFPSAGMLMSRSGVLGGTVLLGVEDLASLELRYSPASVQTILNRCGSVLALRLSDGRSADYFSWRFGDTEYWDVRDPRSGAPEVPWSLVPRCNRLLLASDFLLLEERTGFFLMPGCQPLRMVIPQYDALPSPEVPHFLPRTGLSLEYTPSSDDPAPTLAANLGEEPPRACPPLPSRPRPERPLAGNLEF